MGLCFGLGKSIMLQKSSCFVLLLLLQIHVQTHPHVHMPVFGKQTHTHIHAFRFELNRRSSLFWRCHFWLTVQVTLRFRNSIWQTRLSIEIEAAGERKCAAVMWEHKRQVCHCSRWRPASHLHRGRSSLCKKKSFLRKYTDTYHGKGKRKLRERERERERAREKER